MAAAGSPAASEPPLGSEGTAGRTPPNEGTGNSLPDDDDDDTASGAPVDEGTQNDIPLDEATATDNAAAAAGSDDPASGNPTGVPPASAGDDTAPVMVDSQTCSLRVSVTTTAPGGKYRPRNVGAIWVTDSAGGFVKSLDVWGNRRLSHVVAWNAATRAAGLAGNKVDAVTSATLSTHRAHDVTWDCRDTRDQIMPDGAYRVYFEVTDSNNAGPNHFETFTKGPTAATLQSSATNFEGIALTFNP